MVELVAYEFMSANDAPERDPKDLYELSASKYSCEKIFSILQVTVCVSSFWDRYSDLFKGAGVVQLKTVSNKCRLILYKIVALRRII